MGHTRDGDIANMARLIFIIGGARSGKSRFGQQLAERLGAENVDFIATAEAGDSEMAERIQKHRASRPASWSTHECPTDVASDLTKLSCQKNVLLLDCITLLVSNLLLRCGDSVTPGEAQARVEMEVRAMLSEFARRRGVVIAISSEVGLGLVPEYPLGRLFRDVLGWANQSIAAQADEVYLMVAGLPIELRAIATTLESAADRCNSSLTIVSPQIQS